MAELPSEVLGIWRSDVPPTEGEWWNQRLKFEAPAGELTRLPDGRTQLKLIVTGGDWKFAGPERRTFWGITTTGQRVTMFDAWQINVEGGDPRQESWQCATTLVGDYAPSQDELTLQFAHVRLRGLLPWLTAHWYQPTGYPMYRPEVAIRRSKFGSRRPEFRHRPSWKREIATYSRQLRRERDLREKGRTIKAGIDGVEVVLWVNDQDRQLPGVSSRPQAGLRFRFPRAVTLHDFEQRWLRPLQDLVAFGKDSACSVERLEISNDEFRDRREVLSWGRVPTDSEPHRQLQPLPAPIAWPRGATLISEWYRLHRALEGPGSWFFGYLDGRTQWLDNQLLNLVSFAEAYHRTFHDEPLFDPKLNKALLAEVLPGLPDEVRRAWRERLSHASDMTQRNRLKDLVERATWVVPELAPFEETLVKQLISARNTLTHGADGTRTDEEDHELVAALDRLVVVLRVCIGMELGLWWPAIRGAILWSPRYQIALGLNDLPES